MAHNRRDPEIGAKIKIPVKEEEIDEEEIDNGPEGGDAKIEDKVAKGLLAKEAPARFKGGPHF